MGISVWQIVIVLAIVLLLFGTKKLRSAGTDMGEAISGFRRAVKDESTGEKKNDSSIQARDDKHYDAS